MQRILTLIVGIAFLAIGVFIYIRNTNLIKNCSEEVTATVVDMKQDFDSEGTDYIYYPIIEYKVGKDTIRETIDSGSNVPAYDIDEEITILYNPNKIREFIIKGDITSNIFSIIFVVLGLFITGYGIKITIKGN